MKAEFSRRIALGVIGTIALDAAVSVDRKRNTPVREVFPYAFNPDRQILPGRPVSIWVDERETVVSGRTFTLHAEDIPQETTVLTPRMEQRGYRETARNGLTFYQEAAFVPEQDLQPLREALAPLDALRADRPQVELEVIPLRPDVIAAGLTINAYPDPERNRIEIAPKPDHAIPMETLQDMMFHERLHIIHSTFRFPDSYLQMHTALTVDAKQLLDAYQQHFEEEGLSRAEAFDRKIKDAGVPYDNLPGLKALGPLANLVAESSYNPQADKQAGHPLMDVSELFASTLTVARFYPNSLLASIRELRRPADKAFLKTLLWESIQLLRTYADAPVRADALFSPAILAFINR